MKPKQSIEQSKHCDCKEPKLVGGICQSMKGHFFQWCTKCRREKIIKIDVDEMMKGTV